MKGPLLGVVFVLAAVAVRCAKEPGVKPASGTAVVLQCPDPAASYAPHDLIPLRADVDGLATPVVEFRVNGAVVARDTTPPFETVWRAKDLGSMHFEALARRANGGGDAVRSAAVDITVAPLDLAFQELTLDDIGADLKTGKEPSVLLSSPAYGTVFCHPESITLVAAVTPVAASIARVDFEVDGRPIANVTKRPFVFIWSRPSLGRHAVAVRATDSEGRIGVTRILVLVTGYAAKQGEVRQ